MSIRLHRRGNSVGPRVPKPMLDQPGFAEGSQVEAGRPVIGPARRGRITMAELLEWFTPDNTPGEVDWGATTGRHLW